MQSLGDRLLSAQAPHSDSDSPGTDSLGDVEPRLQSADALRKVSANASLTSPIAESARISLVAV